MKLQLRQLREATNLSQKDVAKLINKTPQAYSFYESGQREPDLVTLIKLADIFEITTDELLNHITNKKNDSISIHSQDERELVRCFRALSSNKKDSLLDFIRFLSSKQDEELPQLKSS